MAAQLPPLQEVAIEADEHPRPGGYLAHEALLRLAASLDALGNGDLAFAREQPAIPGSVVAVRVENPASALLCPS